VNAKNEAAAVEREMFADCMESLNDAADYLRGVHLTAEQSSSVQAKALEVSNWALVAAHRGRLR
jgi:hypothetical protein